MPEVTAKERICFTVGVPRSGTSWLYEQLKAHPDIHLPYRDNFYFNSIFLHTKTQLNYGLGEAWYLNRFHPSPRQICVDPCGHCFSDAVAMKRIASFNPGAKVIITLRNPYEALISHFMSLKQYHSSYGARMNFGEFLDHASPELMNSHRIHEHLMRCFSLFDRTNLMICLYDDLEADPKACVRKIYEFLGVDRQFVSRHVTEKANASRGVRSQLFKKIQFALIACSENNRAVRSIVERVRNIPLAQKTVWGIQKMNFKPKVTFQLQRKEKDRLLDLYQSDLDAFLSLPDFSHLTWSLDTVRYE
jgi:hypothetical protein